MRFRGSARAAPALAMAHLLAIALPALALWLGYIGIGLALLSIGASALIPPFLGRGLCRPARRALLALGAAALLALAISSAPTKASVITEYLMAGDPRPFEIDVDRGGTLWFTEELANRIGRLSGSTFTEWIIPTAGSTPWGIAASMRGSDGKTSMETLPNGTRGIWFTERFGGKIGLLVPTRNGIYEWALGPSSEPKGIVVGYDSYSGKPLTWIADYGGKKIYKFYSTKDSGTISPSEWTLVEYSVPDGARPQGIATAYPGDYVWFTCPDDKKIGRLNHWTGVFTMYTLPSESKPWSIAVDPDGKVWFTDQGLNAVCQLDPANGLIMKVALPTANSKPWGIAVDWGQYSKYDVWFAERESNRIGRYIPGTGALMEYRTPLSVSYPTGLTMDDSGYVWFTEASSFANRIARLNQRVGPTSYTTMTTFSTSTHSTITASTAPYTVATAIITPGAANSSVSTTMSGAGTVTYSTVSDNKTVFVITAPITVTRTSTIPLGTVTETKQDTLTTVVQTWSTTTTTTTSATLTSFISTTTTTLTIPGTFEVTATGTTTTTWYYATTALVNYTVTTTATATTTSTSTLTSWATAIVQATSTTTTTLTTTTTRSTTATAAGPLAVPGFEVPSILVGLGAGAALLRLHRAKRRRDTK